MYRLFIILILAAIVLSCEDETHYLKDGQCCEMCRPGTRMPLDAKCHDPSCRDCEEGEYQNVYNKDTTCKRQPICDPNLNFVKQTNPSKTELSPCQCLPGHHCSSAKCLTCVVNTVCQAGQRVRKMGNQTSDTECESCPHGTFSRNHSASTCQEWTKCQSGFIERVPGSATSDRICKAQFNLNVKVGIVVGVLCVAVFGIILFCCYRKGKTGSMNLQEKLHKNYEILSKVVKNKQPSDNLNMENELVQTTDNQPEEVLDTDTETDQLKHGISANGMPVRQDHSKVSIDSQP